MIVTARRPVPPEDAGLENHPPGPELAALLADIDLTGIDSFDVVEMVKAGRRMASWGAWIEARAIAELNQRREERAERTPPPGGQVIEFVADEIAAALTLTGMTAGDLVVTAVSLAERMPMTLAALGEGRIDAAKARVICNGLYSASDEAVAFVEQTILPKAPEKTTAWLRNAVRKAVKDADPAAHQKRNKEARARQRVELWDNPEDTSDLAGRDLPVDQASRAYNRINAIANALKTDGDDRPIDYIRGEVFKALLLGEDPYQRHTSTDLPPNPDPTPNPPSDEGPDPKPDQMPEENPDPTPQDPPPHPEIGEDPTSGQLDVPASRPDHRDGSPSAAEKAGPSKTVGPETHGGVAVSEDPTSGAVQVPASRLERGAGSPSPAREAGPAVTAGLERPGVARLAAPDVCGGEKPVSGRLDVPAGRLERGAGSSSAAEEAGPAKTAGPEVCGGIAVGEDSAPGGVEVPTGRLERGGGGPGVVEEGGVAETAGLERAGVGGSEVCGGEEPALGRLEVRAGRLQLGGGGAGVAEGDGPAKTAGPETCGGVVVGEESAPGGVEVPAGRMERGDGSPRVVGEGGVAEIAGLERAGVGRVAGSEVCGGEELASGRADVRAGRLERGGGGLGVVGEGGVARTAGLERAGIGRDAGRDAALVCFGAVDDGSGTPSKGPPVARGGERHSRPARDLAEAERARAEAVWAADRLRKKLDGLRGLRGSRRALRVVEAVRRFRDEMRDESDHWCRIRVGVYGQVLHGHDGYRPPVAMQRLVDGRDTTCRFPGCRRASAWCDRDHTIPYHLGGPTCPCNLANLCRRHHRVKQDTRWRLLHPYPGVLVWITPSGHWYVTNPDA